MGVLDSLQAVIAAKDSVIEVAATRATVMSDAKRDLFDWLNLLATLLVAPLIALIATWYGGWLAERGRAREAAKESEQRRLQMQERVRRVLVRAITIADQVKEIPSFYRLGQRSAELRVLWESFERQAGDLYLIETEALRAEIEDFVADLQGSVAGTIAALSDLQERKSNALQGSRMSGVSPTNIEAQHNPTAHLDQFRADMIRLKGIAQQLLAKLQPNC